MKLFSYCQQQNLWSTTTTAPAKSRTTREHSRSAFKCCWALQWSMFGVYSAFLGPQGKVCFTLSIWCAFGCRIKVQFILHTQISVFTVELLPPKLIWIESLSQLPWNCPWTFWPLLFCQGLSFSCKRQSGKIPLQLEWPILKKAGVEGQPAWSHWWSQRDLAPLAVLTCTPSWGSGAAQGTSRSS